MKSNKEKVYEALKKHLDDYSNEELHGLSTMELAELLKMQRTNISAILNDFVAAKKVIKIKQRPVLYRLRKGASLQETNISCIEEIIGHDGSLRNAVELIKAAVLYPQLNFNVLIVGESGSGKSYFARMISRFAIESKVFSEKAPFVRINCRNYIGHENHLSQDLFARKQDNYFEQAEGGFLFIDHVNLLVGKDRERLINFIEKREFVYIDEEKPVKKNVALILACTEDINHDVYEYLSQKITINVKIPNLASRPLEERLQFINLFFSSEATKAGKTFVVNGEILRCLMIYDCPYNVRQLKSDIRVGCAHAFVRSRNGEDDSVNMVMSDFDDNIRKGFINYKKHRYELERVLPDEATYRFNQQSEMETVTSSYSTDVTVYQMIDSKINELKERGLEDDEVNIVTASHIQLMVEKYQRFLTKQSLNIGQLSKVVDPIIIRMVQEFLDTAQEKFGVTYPLSLYYGLSLHVNSLLQANVKTQRLGNKQIMEIIQQYQAEYMYCLQFMNRLEEQMRIKIPVDEAVIITMFIVEKNQVNSSRHPVVLVAMHGLGTATSIAQVINTLVHANNAYGFDMSLDSEPLQMYQSLKEMIKQIDQGKGVIVIYDMGSFKNMLESIVKETKIEIRPLYVPITLLGIEAARRSSLEEDVDEVYHQLIQSFREISEVSEYKRPVIVTLCNTGEGGALQLKNYLDLHCRKSRTIIPLAISDRKKLVQEIKAIVAENRIQCFVGTFDPNLFGIPFISISEVFECSSNKLDNLLDFNLSQQSSIDMEAIYEYLDDSLEFVDIQKIKKYLPPLLEAIEEISGDAIGSDQKLGLFVHIACSINRCCANEPTPVNIQKNQIIAKYEKLFRSLLKIFKPVERAFDIIISDDEIANIISMIKKI